MIKLKLDPFGRIIDCGWCVFHPKAQNVCSVPFYDVNSVNGQCPDLLIHWGLQNGGVLSFIFY